MSTAEAVEFSPVPLGNLEPHDAAMQIVRRAVSMAASDLFLLSDDGAISVAVRTMGEMERLAAIPKEQGRHLINFFKTQAEIDIAEHRRPQEGRWLFQSNGDRIDLRINVVPTLYGEDLAVRILDRRAGLRS